MFLFKKKEKNNNLKKLSDIYNNEILNYERELRYSENNKVLKLICSIIITIIIIIIVNFFINVFNFFKNVNTIVAWGVVIVLLILIIKFLIIPFLKLFQYRSFKISLLNSKKYNDKLCDDIADHIIDFSDKFTDNNWYDKEIVKELKDARFKGDKTKLRNVLTTLMNTSIKDSSNKIMAKYSKISGVSSAISQWDKMDALLVLITNINMIKELVLLYGFRPTTIKMCKICFSVIMSIGSAYFLENSKTIEKVSSKGLLLISNVLNGMSWIPSLPLPPAIYNMMGSALNVTANSVVQGVANYSISMIIGYQTINYLKTEYRLQDVLNGIDLLDSEAEIENTKKQIDKVVKGNM